MRTLAPGAAVSPFVRDFMVVETAAEVSRLRLPETGFVLGVRYRGAARWLDDGSRVPDLSLVGVSRRARPMRTSSAGAVLLARFQPGGAARVFGARLHAFFDASASLSALFTHGDLDRLHAQVSEAGDDRARVEALERFLLRHTKYAPDALVARATRALRETPALRVRDLAKQLGLSVDALEKRFRREVGCTPRQFASLTRMHAAIDTYRPQNSLTRLALDAGYFDQSHFNREFRATLGVTPGEYFRAR